MSGRHRHPRRSAHALPERDEKPFLPVQAARSIAGWARTLSPAAWTGDALRRARYSRAVQIEPVTDKDVMDGIRFLRRAQEREQLTVRRLPWTR